MNSKYAEWLQQHQAEDNKKHRLQWFNEFADGGTVLFTKPLFRWLNMLSEEDEIIPEPEPELGPPTFHDLVKSEAPHPAIYWQDYLGDSMCILPGGILAIIQDDRSETGYSFLETNECYGHGDDVTEEVIDDLIDALLKFKRVVFHLERQSEE